MTRPDPALATTYYLAVLLYRRDSASAVRMQDEESAYRVLEQLTHDVLAKPPQDRLPIWAVTRTVSGPDGVGERIVAAFEARQIVGGQVLVV